MHIHNKLGGRGIEIEPGGIHSDSHPKNAGISLSVYMCLCVTIARSQLRVKFYKVEANAVLSINTAMLLSDTHTVFTFM